MRQRVSAILVAAGLSTRMGRLKQLLPVRGKPVILRGIQCLLASGLEDVVVVLNPAHGDLLKIVEKQPVRMAFNETPGSDMAESVRTGLRFVDGNATGILVHLADYPLVSVDTLRKLVGQHGVDPSRILVPSYESRGGHPVLFPAELAQELSRGGTLRDIGARHHDRKRFVPVTDEGVVMDIDTPEDYDRVAGLVSTPKKETGDVRMSG